MTLDVLRAGPQTWEGRRSRRLVSHAPAFQCWAAVVPIAFHETHDFEGAYIKIEFLDADGFPLDRRLGVLSEAFGRFHLHNAEVWRVSMTITITDGSIIFPNLESTKGQYGKDGNKIILDVSFVESSTGEETEMIWKYFYPYELDLSHSVSGKSSGMSSLFHPVSPPRMFHDWIFRGAEKRYKGFLRVHSKKKDTRGFAFVLLAVSGLNLSTAMIYSYTFVYSPKQMP